MKQFATYFTHGVQNGAKLRAKSISPANRSRFSKWWTLSSVENPRLSDKPQRKQVKIITDGSCLGNPGRGGWAAILRYGDHKKEVYGSSAHTTNNRMELTAAIEALRTLRHPCDVELVTDSEYLKNGITKWIENWRGAAG